MYEIDLNTLPDEFKELLRSKLKKQDEATYNEALEMFGANLLGFYKVYNAAPGSIDIDEIKEARRKAQQEEVERRIRYEAERAYYKPLNWWRIMTPSGEYSIAKDDNGIIRNISFESSNHREGGSLYENTPFRKFGDFDRVREELKEKCPELYRAIANYKPE